MNNFKNKFTYYLSVIIPIALFIISFSLRQSQGPYFLNTHYDPVYPYLISSLNLVQFSQVTLVEHPGTSVQLIGAAVIKIFYLIDGKNPDIAVDVLSRPEEYLLLINLILILINCAIVYFLGRVVFKYTGNIWISLLIQLSTFISYTISYELAIFIPENFLIVVINILIAVLFKFLYCDDALRDRKFYFPVLFSIVCGLGISTKITFIPLVIIPFVLLKGLKPKLLFLTFTFIFFIIFVSPVIAKYEYFLSWIKKLFVYDGLYGAGKPDIVDTVSFISNLEAIFINEKIFTFIYLLILMTIISVSYRYYRRFEKLSSLLQFKLLVGIFLSMTFQIIIVAKHYSGHYMLPSLMMAITGLFLCINILFENFDLANKKINLNYVYGFLILLFSVFITVSSSINISDSKIERDEALKLNDYINANYPGSVLISSYGSSSKEYAFAFGTNWAGPQKQRYQKIINGIYPDKIYYEYWKRNLYSFSESESVKDILDTGKKIVFQCKRGDSNEKILDILKSSYKYNDPELIEVFTNLNGESVFEIKLN